MLAGLKDLTRFVDRDITRPLGHGAFGDVYKGLWIADASERRKYPEIVVKVLRQTATIDPQDLERRWKGLRRELAVWHLVDHENIVPFIGITFIYGVLPSIVSAWMPQGTLRLFLARNPRASRDRIAIEIAQGLSYLHTDTGLKKSIVHGDLKPDNILIDRNGVACLCDFGLSRVLEDATLWDTSDKTAPGMMRYKAPELITREQSTVTMESDIYAYGMTCYVRSLVFLSSCY